MKCRILYSLALLAALLGMVACSQTAGSDVDRMIDIGSHSMHITCIGEGSPTVVIDVGWGDSPANWHVVQEQIARDTRVCVYDRAGYGRSEPGPMPRTSQQVAEELKALLEKANVEGPYVVVGHSLGGLNMQVFASQHPELVAGVVLLDPPPLGFITGQRFPELYQMAAQETAGLLTAAEQARQATAPEERAKADYLETLASEHAMMFEEGGEQAAAVESFGDVPLIVLASGQPNPHFGDSAEAFQQFWIEENQALANRSTEGSCIVAEESGHNLYADGPDLVVDTIRQIVEKTQE